MNIRKLIRETIEEVMLSEAAFNSSDILSNPDLGILAETNNSFSVVILYDYKLHKALGMISCRATDNPDIIQFVAVAAEKGYGPIMYEFGMMLIYSKFLVPTRDADIRGTAFGVWEKFTQRADVEHLVLDEEDPGFSEDYFDMGDEAAVVGNTACRKSPSGEFKQLIAKGEELGNKYKISKERVKQDGDNFFGYKYADS